MYGLENKNKNRSHHENNDFDKICQRMKRSIKKFTDSKKRPMPEYILRKNLRVHPRDFKDALEELIRRQDVEFSEQTSHGTKPKIGYVLV